MNQQISTMIIHTVYLLNEFTTSLGYVPFTLKFNFFQFFRPLGCSIFVTVQTKTK